MCRTALDGRKWCAQCAARKRRSQVGEPFDFDAYVKMLFRANDPLEVCSVSGLSLQTLRKVGDLLTIDRVDPAKGYVRGNMRLLSRVLNTARVHTGSVPAATLAALRRRTLGVVTNAEAGET